MVVDNVDYTSGMEKNMSREFTDLTDTLCFGVSHQISIHLKICLAYLCFALVFPSKLASFKPQFNLPLKTGYVLNLIVFTAIRISYGEKGTSSWMSCGTFEVNMLCGLTTVSETFLLIC